MQYLTKKSCAKAIFSLFLLCCAISGTAKTRHAHVLEDTSSVDPRIFISPSENPFIAPALMDIDFTFEGFRNFEYLRVMSDRDGFNKLKLGYDKYTLFKHVIDVNYGYVEIVLKDFSGTANWSKIEFRPNEEVSARVNLSGYIINAETLPDGWLRIQIPLSDWGANQKEFSQLKYIAFPYSRNAGMFNIGIRQIRFIGGGNELEWLGPNKNDNIHDGDNTGPSLLANKVYGEGPAVEEIQVIDSDSEVLGKKTQMPFSIPVILASGTYQLVGRATDELGNIYYSDTVRMTIGKGISFNVNDVSCNGGSDGGIDATIDGGTAPYSFSWNTGSSNEDLVNVIAGISSLEVEDADGNKFERTAKIRQPLALEANIERPSSCSDSINIQVFGGYGPYGYQLDNHTPVAMGDGITKLRAKIESDGYYNRFKDIVADKTGSVYFSGILALPFNIGDSTLGKEGDEGVYMVKINARNQMVYNIIFKQSPAGYDPNSDKLEMAIDGNDNLYVAFSAFVEFTVNLGSTEISIPARSSVLFKFNSNGEYLWYVPLDVMAVCIGTDATDDLYLAANKDEDIILKKITPDGTILWTKTFGGNKIDAVDDMVVNDNGDIFLIGAFDGTAYFDGLSLTTAGDYDIFLTKVTKEGKVEWAKSGGGHSRDFGQGITLNKKGQLIAGISAVSPHFDFDVYHVDQRIIAIGSFDADNGNVNWINPFVTWNSPYLFSGVDGIATDASDNIYVTGETFEHIKNGAIDTDNPGVYTIKLDSLGNGLFVESGKPGLYDFNKGMPITSYLNGVVNATYLNNQFVAIKEYGHVSNKKIHIPAGVSTIAITDNNGCFKEFMLQDSVASLATEICYATVALSGGILIHWSASEGDVQEIYRETNRLGEYNLIGTSGAGEEIFTDADADPLVRSYRYKLKTIQSCSGESDFSAPHKTMHLTVNEGNKGQINLIWEGYEGFEYKSFQIYRGATPEDMEFLAELPSNLFTYTDYDPSPSTLYYQISVEANGSCDSNKSITNGKTAEDVRVVQSNIANKFGQLGGLSLYPNPANDQISIRFNPDGNTYKLSMIDMKGRVVRSQEGLFDRGTIYTQNLPQGIYTIIVTDEKGHRLRGNIIIR